MSDPNCVQKLLPFRGDVVHLCWEGEVGGGGGGEERSRDEVRSRLHMVVGGVTTDIKVPC